MVVLYCLSLELILVRSLLTIQFKLVPLEQLVASIAIYNILVRQTSNVDWIRLIRLQALKAKQLYSSKHRRKPNVMHLKTVNSISLHRSLKLPISILIGIGIKGTGW